MMKHTCVQFCLLVAVLLSLGSCQPENDKNPAMIGQWQGKEWLVFGKPAGMNAAAVSFSFDENGHYTAAFGDQKEQGVWRTNKDKLYTTAEGKQEIMVKIIALTETTLKFEMNRGGQQETLELTKQ